MFHDPHNNKERYVHVTLKTKEIERFNNVIFFLAVWKNNNQRVNMPHKRIPKRLPSNVDYNITSNWTPIPSEIAAKRLNKKPGKNSLPAPPAAILNGP